MNASVVAGNYGKTDLKRTLTQISGGLNESVPSNKIEGADGAGEDGLKKSNTVAASGIEQIKRRKLNKKEKNMKFLWNVYQILPDLYYNFNNKLKIL